MGNAELYQDCTLQPKKLVILKSRLRTLQTGTWAPFFLETESADPLAELVRMSLCLACWHPAMMLDHRVLYQTQYSTKVDLMI